MARYLNLELAAPLTEPEFVYCDLLCWALFSDAAIERRDLNEPKFPAAQRHVAPERPA